jgi:hypothetical protein
MRTRVMEDAQGYYSHEDKVRGIHVNMGNDETNSNWRRDIQEPKTMRILHREVHSYRADNEMITKDQE